MKSEVYDFALLTKSHTMKILIICCLITTLSYNNAISQCGETVNIFCEQQMLDNVENWNCIELDTVSLGIWSQDLDKDCENRFQIFDLKGFKNIERINYINFRSALVNLATLEGLEKIRYIRDLDYDLKATIDYTALTASLDTIINLNHQFRTDRAPLSMYSEVNYIESITFSGDTDFSDLNSLAKENLHRIRISNNSTESNLGTILPKQKDSIEVLNLHLVNLFIDTLYKIKHTNVLRLGRLSEIDLSRLSSLNCDELVLFQVESEFVSEDEELESFRIVDMQNLTSIDALIPNLKSINGSIEIRNNPELNNINFLNDFEAPLYDVPYTPQFSVAHLREMIVIADNPKLDSCNLDYLCKTLELYPDSVRIENNGIACTLEEVKKYCGLTSTNDNQNKEFIVFPNPANTELNWESDRRIENYQIFTALGDKVKSNKLTKNGPIDIAHLTKGLYFIRFSNQYLQWTTSFIKN